MLYMERFIYLRASQVVIVAKNPPANAGDILETRFWSLGWEDPLEEGMKSTPVFLPGESHRQRIAWRAMVHRVAKSRTQLSE